MILTGITAEFNPFHNGHAYLMREARRLTDADAVIVVMTGDFVQRGDLAIIDKWTRAGCALSNGADLVIELPVLFSLEHAGRFASAAVGILEAAGCAHIAFGSETGDLHYINLLAERLRNKYMGHHTTHPVLETHTASCNQIIKESVSCSASGQGTYIGPNDHLASEYVLNMKRARPVAIPRLGAGYYDGITDTNGTIQSASGIRELIRADYDIGRTDCDNSRIRCDISRIRCDIGPFVPENTLDSLITSAFVVNRDALWVFLKDAIMAADPEWIDDCPSGGKGIGLLFQEKAAEANSYDVFIQAVKTNRYTYARLYRLVLQVLLGITKTKYPYKDPEYIRVLAYNDQGRQVIERMQDASDFLPVIMDPAGNLARLNESASSMLALDEHAEDIYNRIKHFDSLH